jgi:flagellar hook-basal body complex protein FliE
VDGIRIDFSKMHGSDVGNVFKSPEVAAPARSFEDSLKEAVVGVNELQMDSNAMVQRLSLGDVDDVSEVTLSVEKASLAFQLLVRVRDKLVDAYQQLSRMAV